MRPQSGATSATDIGRQSSNSARLSVLQERVLREVEERMGLVTDNEEWKPPTQAAIECGLHYTYIAYAITLTELSVAIQAVSSPRGRTKMVVVNMPQVHEWLESRCNEAMQADKSLPEYLSTRYNMDRILTVSNPQIPDDLPSDLIPLDVARQLLIGRDLPVELLDDSVSRGTIVIHDVCGERMVSEDAVVLLTVSTDGGEERPMEVDDPGECECSQAADRMAIDRDVLLAACESGECVARADGDIWLVHLRDVVTWYDTFHETPQGRPRIRYILVNVDERQGMSHYDTPIRCRFAIPDVPAISNNMCTSVLAGAIDRSITFRRGEPVPVGNVKRIIADVELSVGSLLSASYLADVSGHIIDDYMTLLALHETSV